MSTEHPANTPCRLPDPDAVHSPRELVVLLRLLKSVSGLTYRQLESRARRAGLRLPRSTIASALTRDALPKEEFVTALAHICGADAEPWQEAYRRVTVQSGDEECGPHALFAQPRQTPYCPPDLTGHEQELRTVVEWLASPRTEPPVTVVTGPPGVGKTVLALRTLPRVASHFPNGHLYVELRGNGPDGAPVPVRHVVTRLLRGLGVRPQQLPTDLGEGAALLRSLLAERRVLVLLDDATSAGQIRPLVPAQTQSAFLVTSRSALVSLDGTRHVRLAPLPLPEAEAVLLRMLGEVRRRPCARLLRELTTRCDGLPLALRIAAARLMVQTDKSAKAFLARLADERHCLDALRVNDLELRATFAGAYRDLLRQDDSQHTLARTFLLFGRSGADGTTAPAMADALRQPLAMVERAAEQLLDAHLVEGCASGQLRMPRLLRSFAREEAERDAFAAGRRRLAG
ncbi:NB-ARC domain-containing protein [Streptomyces prasinus]